MHPDDDLPAVIATTRRDIDTVAALAAQATREHPLVTWLIPKAERRTGILHAWWAPQVRDCLHERGHVDLLADHSAAAIWLDRTRPELFDYQRNLAAFGPHADAAALLAQVLAVHRPATAHQHLAVLAVTPTRARRGRAKALLEHPHRHLDRSGIYAYLEAGLDDRLASYTALGYTPGAPFHTPAGPAILPMLRAPRNGHRVTALDEPFWPPHLT